MVDIKSHPIQRVTKTGLETELASYDFDVIIYATGFDAVTGALDKIEITGEQGTLKEMWDGSPSTYLGICANGFPNMFIAGGPHNTTSFCNIPRCIEHNVEWITETIEYMEKNNYTRIEASQPAQDAWTEHALSLADETLFVKNDSWLMGSNIPGKKRVFLNYVGGVPLFLEKLSSVTENNYQGFNLE